MDDIVEGWTGRHASLLCRAYRERRPEFSDEHLAEKILGVAARSLYYWRNSPERALRPSTQLRLKQVLNDAPYDVRTRFRDLLAGDGRQPADIDDDRISHALRNPRSLDLLGVAELRQRVQHLDENYDHVPSASLLPDAGQALGHASFLVVSASNAPVRNELRAVETAVATLMGQLVWDASLRRDHQTACDYFDRAVQAARTIGNVAAEAHALLRKSYVALYGGGHPGAGLALTEQAAATALSTSNVLTGLALLHSADANAMLGRERPCQEALLKAESVFEKINSDDVAAHLFSPTQFDRLAGSCYLYLGDLRRAERTLEDAAHQLQQHNKSRALILGNLSLARLRRGDLDAAAATLHRAIDVLEVNRAGGGLNKVFVAAREMHRWRDEPLVQDVQDRLLSLMTPE